MCHAVYIDGFGYVLFFKQKTAYEMRISDWSSDVCSSDLEKLDDDIRAHLGDVVRVHPRRDFVSGLSALGGKTVTVDPATAVTAIFERLEEAGAKIGRASCRERVCQVV